VALINQLLRQPERTSVSMEAQLLGLFAVMRGACAPASAPKVAEALASGDVVKAVAASDSPDAVDALGALRAGVLLSPAQAEALQHALAHFFNDP